MKCKTPELALRSETTKEKKKRNAQRKVANMADFSLSQILWEYVHVKFRSLQTRVLTQNEMLHVLLFTYMSSLISQLLAVKCMKVSAAIIDLYIYTYIFLHLNWHVSHSRIKMIRLEP